MATNTDSPVEGLKERAAQQSTDWKAEAHVTGATSRNYIYCNTLLGQAKLLDDLLAHCEALEAERDKSRKDAEYYADLAKTRKR